MDDLISRKATAKKLRKKSGECVVSMFATVEACQTARLAIMDAAMEVENMPAVDAVEVVRCKDCVNMGKLVKGYKEGCGCCMVHGWIVSPEDFCSWGETADEKYRREAAEQDAYEQLCNLGNPEDGSL